MWRYTSNQAIKYTTSKGVQTEERFDVTEGLWFAFALYGVKIPAVNNGEDQIDSVCNNLRSKDCDIIEKPLNSDNENVDLQRQVNDVEHKLQTPVPHPKNDKQFAARPGMV